MTQDWALPGTAAAFRDYLVEVGRDLAAGNATEHTHRPALKALLIALDPEVRPVNEPARIACGAPDYIVTRRELPVGYIEAKDVGRSLDEIERSEQLARYRESLSNLILTDYLEFRWYKDGEKQQTARIAYLGDSGKLRPDREGQRQAAALFSTFLAQQPPIVGKPEELAKRMAALARTIRDTIAKALENDTSGSSSLRDQLEGFRRVLIHDLNAAQFADMYAQTIAYGLFAARVNAPADERFSRRSAAYDLPRTNPFLRQMFGHIAGPDLDERIAWAVDDLAELLARARMDLVLADFGKRTRQEDPVVHFYETFLKAYDPKMREARGVYYTPEPVVSYIVRSVDHILKTEFGLPDGLADNSMIEVPTADGKGTRKVHKVQILDPATGTGTFLAQVIETIRDTVVAKHGAGMWPGYVHQHLLPRLYGFELLMAPYAIAHLKLGMRLKETGYDIDQSERLQVYLTNSLEEAHEREQGQLSFFGSWLAEEADRASEVKRELPIMVVLGNPPYSVSSQNKGPWITDLLKDYKVGLNEKKLNLDDDFIKFLRFAQWRIERTGAGVVGFVTNNAYLDGPTHRRMRSEILSAFDSVRVLDLHGSSRKREIGPKGDPEENVFDIQQGVAIALLARTSETGGRAASHGEIWGSRSGKYSWLASHSCADTEWEKLPSMPPSHLFVPVRGNADEYAALTPLATAFEVLKSGLNTDRDGLCIDFDADVLRGRMKRLFDGDIDDAFRQRYGLHASSSYNPLAAAQGGTFDESAVRHCIYRPFDARSIYYQPGFTSRPVFEAQGHMLSPNIGLLLARQSKEAFGTLVTRHLSTHKIVAVYDRTSLAPLYLYDHPGSLKLGDVGRRPNFTAAFVSALSRCLGQPLVPDDADRPETGWTADDALAFIYAVLYSPAYRERYAEFLKFDFPRIPLTSDRELFRELCRLGSRLVTLHLMEADDLAPITTYPVAGDNHVDKPRYTEPGQGAEQGRVWVNATQYFEGVPPEVWAFHVGGYQVCAKWLKDRKGRRLTYDDLTHYQYVVAALAETIRLMGEIDEAIDAHGGWPIK